METSTVLDKSRGPSDPFPDSGVMTERLMRALSNLFLFHVVPFYKASPGAGKTLSLLCTFALHNSDIWVFSKDLAFACEIHTNENTFEARSQNSLIVKVFCCQNKSRDRTLRFPLRQVQTKLRIRFL